MDKLHSLKIETKELISDIKLVIKDEFVAVFSDTDNGFIMRFENGQSFCVAVSSVLSGQ